MGWGGGFYMANCNIVKNNNNNNNDIEKNPTKNKDNNNDINKFKIINFYNFKLGKLLEIIKELELIKNEVPENEYNNELNNIEKEIIDISEKIFLNSKKI